MSVQKFIAELERRSLLSDRVVTRLRESTTQGRSFTAKALAKFLVDKNRLTEKQADDVLNSLSDSGVNLDATIPTEELVAASSSIQVNPKEMTLAEVELAPPEDDGGSSIFEPFPSGIQNKRSQSDEDDLSLTPIDEDMEAASASASVQLKSDDALRLNPEMTDEPVQPKPQRRKMADVIDEKRGKKPAPSADEDELITQPPSADTKSTPTVRMTTRLSRPTKKKKSTAKKGKPTKSAKQWDSPLILLGGGGLVLLILCGAAVYWLMNWESGDQQLASARAAADSGAYSQAIQHYEDFLTGSSRHPERSLARVQLAMVRIRQATEAKDYAGALDLAVKELGEIENEADFDEAQGEIAALLPQIATGLAEQAEAAPVGSEEATKLVEQTNKALDLCNNDTFLPKRLRDAAKLTIVQETLQRVDRRQQTQRALDDALKQIDEAIAASNTAAAYKVHAQLLKERPELADDQTLAQALQKTTAAETAAVSLVNEEQPAETTERPAPWIASLAIANRRIQPSTDAASRAVPGPGAPATAVVRIDGAVYGLDVATGRLLWRRHVGHARSAWPMQSGSEVFVADAARHELLRLDAATGRLIWRQIIGEPFAMPLVVGDRGFVPAESGKLYVIDLKSGAQTGYVQFAQPLHVTPTADRDGKRMYLPGDHSTLYSISLPDLACVGVYYLGHAEGSISVPPIVVGGKVALMENDGVETSRLRLMSLGENGAIAKQVAERRLAGLATEPPFVAGRRAVVISDRGQIEVYEIAEGTADEVLTVVATRAAAGNQPLVRHAALANRNIWVGDTQLTKFSILPTGNRLPVEGIENNFTGSAFDHPLTLLGNTLIHVRRANGRAGAIVTGTDITQGRTLWETDVAMPPAGAPIVDVAGKTIVAGNADGFVFRFDEAAIRARVQDEPLAAQSRPATVSPLTAAVDLGQGRAAFCAAGSDQLLLYNPAAGAAQWLQLESPLASPVAPLGEGFIAPLKIGQVFYLNSADGAKLATPFQPTLKPQTTWDYQPIGTIAGDARRFVIADGRDKIYLVALVDQPQPHLKAVAEAATSAEPIESPVNVLGDTALTVAGSTQLVRFQLPSLQSAGDSKLPAPVVWGPFRAGDMLLLATADGQMSAVSSAGEVVWKAPFEHGDLTGAPLVLEDSVLVAYRKGILERRALADGKPLGAKDVETPLASGPVAFMQRFVLAANDGTLLVVDQP